MKNFLLSLFAIICFTSLKATIKDSTIQYFLPDSVKAVQFLAEIKVQGINGNKELFTGIKTNQVKLMLESDKKGKEIVFEFPKSATIMAAGINTDVSEKGEIAFNYNWNINETYKLLLAVAADSAANFTLYSGYAWLPKENKWKLIGTCKIEGQWNTIQNPAIFFSADKKGSLPTKVEQVWCQRINGGWKNLKNEDQPVPVINLSGHMDSIQQRLVDVKLIEDAILTGKTDVKENVDNVYYHIMEAGTGPRVALTDNVTVFYKGYLFNNGEVFDQTKDKPASFPLNRLIKGWQTGVPLANVGGKIKLVIPSDMAYSIRTRSPKIPPNSILVFEIEIVEAKPQ